MKRRSPKRCANCGKKANRSVALIVSTTGVVPRQQEAARSVPWCGDCPLIGSGDDSGAIRIGRAIRAANNAIQARIRNLQTALGEK